MKYKIKNVLNVLVCIIIASILIACVSRNSKLFETDALLESGNYAEAYDSLQSSKKKIYKGNKDEIIYLLDSGMLALYAKNTETSLSELSDADKKMDNLRGKNIGEQIAASTLNDNLITYNGYDYEYVFTSMMLSINYLLQNKFDDGFVEIRRTQDKLQKIQVDNNLLLQQYNEKQSSDGYVDVKEIKTPFVDSAFGRLLSFWLYRADYDLSNMEVAARKYEEAIIAQPIIYEGFEPPTIQNTQFNMQGTRIQIVAMTDRAPILYSKGFYLNAVSGGIIVTSYDESSSLPNTLAPVEGAGSFFESLAIIPVPGLQNTGLSIVFNVPAMAVYDDKITHIEVWANDEKLGDLTLTENLEHIAVRTFQEESKIIYARQLSRVIIKSIAGVAANQVDPLLGLAAQIANNASERADVRMTRYFPGKIWTGDFSVPAPDEYHITLKYYNNTTLVKETTQTQSITNENDSFNLIVDYNL